MSETYTTTRQKPPKKTLSRTRIDGNETRTSNLSKDQEVEANSGIDGAKLNEKLPKLKYPTTSTVIGNGQDFGRCHIEFGRDRINERDDKFGTFKYGSGNGGLGAMASGCVRITAGLASYDQCRGNVPSEPVNPSTDRDAAMCYISQNANVDDEFDCSGINVKNRSCVAIKADELRFLARGTLKLITTNDKFNSKGRELGSVGDIHLIAGNQDVTDEDGEYTLLEGAVRMGNPLAGEPPIPLPVPTGQNPYFKVLQPVPRGDLLVAALDEVVERLAVFSDLMYDMWNAQMTFNSAVKSHNHHCPGTIGLGGMVGQPLGLNGGKSYMSPGLQIKGVFTGIKQHIVQIKKQGPFHVTLQAVRQEYLTTGAAKSILSTNVKTT